MSEGRAQDEKDSLEARKLQRVWAPLSIIFFPKHQIIQAQVRTLETQGEK